MRIKKYVAPTLKEASLQMKQELGDQAIILSTRIIEGDEKSGNRKLFEITSGIEDDNIPQFENSISSKDEDEKPDPKAYAEEIKKLASKVYTEKQNITFDLPVKDKSTPGSSKPKTARVNDNVQQVVDTLIENEVDQDIITQILKQLKTNNLMNPANVYSYIVSSISALIPTVNFELRNKNKTKIVSLVGPTGVGKTTSIAKLAVISKIVHNLEIGLISIDTYRLGALDQLRIFSEVSNIDMLVAYEPDEMPKLIESFRKKDIVFIDTVGRSQKNIDSLAKTKEFLDIINVDEIMLVLSATHSSRNLLNIAEKFNIFKYDSLLFTKIDEAVTYGNILNVVAKTNKPTMFLTNGQVIPDDIISADAGMIAKLIYTGVLGS